MTLRIFVPSVEIKKLFVYTIRGLVVIMSRHGTAKPPIPPKFVGRLTMSGKVNYKYIPAASCHYLVVTTFVVCLGTA